MRINKFIAQASGLSRRAADEVIQKGRVYVNGTAALLGQSINDSDMVIFNGKMLRLPSEQRTILFYKPSGYVVSRRKHDDPIIYDMLPKTLHDLKPVGRLDKESSGLLLLTTDGILAQKLTHPKYKKVKKYEVELDKQLTSEDQKSIEKGVVLDDGISKFGVQRSSNDQLLITMSEGRNRQIRRTFNALGYEITRLHRIQFGPYKLGTLAAGNWQYI